MWSIALRARARLPQTASMSLTYCRPTPAEAAHRSIYAKAQEGGQAVAESVQAGGKMLMSCADDTVRATGRAARAKVSQRLIWPSHSSQISSGVTMCNTCREA